MRSPTAMSFGRVTTGTNFPVTYSLNTRLLDLSRLLVKYGSAGTPAGLSASSCAPTVFISRLNAFHFYQRSPFLGPRYTFTRFCKFMQIDRIRVNFCRVHDVPYGWRHAVKNLCDILTSSFDVDKCYRVRGLFAVANLVSLAMYVVRLVRLRRVSRGCNCLLGRRPLGAALRSSDEPSDLSQWPRSWWQHYKYCRGYYYYYYYYSQSPENILVCSAEAFNS